MPAAIFNKHQKIVNFHFGNIVIIFFILRRIIRHWFKNRHQILQRFDKIIYS